METESQPFKETPLVAVQRGMNDLNTAYAYLDKAKHVSENDLTTMLYFVRNAIDYMGKSIENLERIKV